MPESYEAQSLPSVLYEFENQPGTKSAHKTIMQPGNYCTGSVPLPEVNNQDANNT